MKRAILATLALALTACGAVVTPEYAGEPLATLKGALEVSPGVPASSSIRLALAWFPSQQMEGDPLTQPKGFITEDVVYEGSFPLNYQFHIRAPPPRDAMGDWSGGGGPTSAAIGILLAYEDRNGNARLDTIPADGVPIDRVLAASMDVYTADGFAVVYFDGELPNPDALAKQLHPGFNLVRSPAEGEPAVVPIDTPVPLVLTGNPDLNLFVCDAFVSPETATRPCGIEGGSVFISASVEVRDQGGAASISVYDAGGGMVAAEVTVNGIPAQAIAPGLYDLDDPAGELFVPGGSYAVEARVDGKTVATAQVIVPGDFAITSPLPGAVLQSGAAVNVGWTDSFGANDYYVTIESDLGDLLESTTTTATAWTSPAIAHEGGAIITVFAIRDATGGMLGGSYGAVVRAVTVQFAP